MPSADKPTFPGEVLSQIRSSKIIAVVVSDHPHSALKTTESLLQGGVTAIELALRTPQAFSCARAIAERFPEMLLGLGTLIHLEQVAEAIESGAAFAVSPGTNPAVIRRAQEFHLPFAPGVATPSDIETAVSCGCRLLKFFPAEQLGGLNYLRSMAGPYAHLGLEYIPLGGLDEENFMQYLSEPDIPAVGGSWMCPASLIKESNWNAITKNSRVSVKLATGLME